MQHTYTYSFVNGHNGGRSAKRLLAVLRDAGIKASPGHSPFVAHSAIDVTGGIRAHNKAGRIIYGR